MQIEATRSATSSKAATQPEFATILGRVRELRSEIQSRDLATEKAKRVPAETMEALRDTGVFRTMQPKRFGGYEYGPACADRLRTWARLREHRLVRDAGGLFWLEDSLLSTRGAAGGL
jgi:hypothetical protein